MNVVWVSDELGRAVETYTLDLQDRPIEVTHVESQKMTITYGLGDRVWSIIRFDGATARGITATGDSNSSLQCGSASSMIPAFRGT